MFDSSSLAPSRAGDVIGGRYRIEHEIGRGGMGVVYRAQHQLTLRRVAIKFLDARHGGRVFAPERLLSEARTAATVRHANVVDVLDMGMHDETPFLVMEVLHGVSLESARDRAGMPPERALEWLLPIMGALAMLHDHGIVHGDVKPSNIFLSRVGEAVVPKLLDFGLARASSEPSLTHGEVLYGTPLYMAPEQAAGQSAGARSELWSVGVLLFECLSGRTPFAGGDGAVVLPLQSVRPDIPCELAAAVDRALQRDLTLRHATMRAFVLSLVRAAALGGVALPDDPDPQGLPEFRDWLSCAEAARTQIDTCSVEHDIPLSAPVSPLDGPADGFARGGQRRESRKYRLLGTLLGATASSLSLGVWLWDLPRGEQRGPSLEVRSEARASSSRAQAVFAPAPSQQGPVGGREATTTSSLAQTPTQPREPSRRRTSAAARKPSPPPSERAESPFEPADEEIEEEWR